LANGAIDNNPNRAPIRELVPDDLLLRALLKKAWLDSLHEAFMLRADEDGLSVCFDCAPEECIAILNLTQLAALSAIVDRTRRERAIP
jgi:hypothetical protein